MPGLRPRRLAIDSAMAYIHVGAAGVKRASAGNLAGNLVACATPMWKARLRR
jgi:hypothetical protein